MPAEQILVPHDDGRWYPADLLGQNRSAGGWRVGVRYSVTPGEQYQRVLWAEDCRALPAAELEHDDQGDTAQ